MCFKLAWDISLVFSLMLEVYLCVVPCFYRMQMKTKHTVMPAHIQEVKTSWTHNVIQNETRSNLGENQRRYVKDKARWGSTDVR